MTTVQKVFKSGKGKFSRTLKGGLALGLGLFLTVTSAFAAGGTVSGTVHVKKTYVDPTGPKSDKEVVVYLVPAAKTALTPPAVHAKMNQLKLNFVPHLLAIQTGTTVDFLNQDSVNHNVSSPAACCSFDLGQWGKDGVKSYQFTTAGVAPIICSLHPEMAAYVVVLDTPYFTTVSLETDNAAKKQYAAYSLTGVPAGDYTLKACNGKLVSTDQKVTVAADGTVSADIDIHKK